MSLRRKILAGMIAVALVAMVWATPAVGEEAWTDAEKEDFLLRAEITSEQRLSVGITGSRRATLSLGSRSHDAHIQTIDVFKRNLQVGDQTHLVFRDSYRYNIAAYRLDRMLGLHMVPVSVERVVKGEKAAVTWWVDDVQMMEKERQERGLRAPSPRSWSYQLHDREVFRHLVYNLDLNQGNILITHGWRVWLVDFTRAFKPTKKLKNPAALRRIESTLLARLRGLDRESLEARLADCLTGQEIKMLLARRDAMVEVFERRIAEKGRPAVVYEDPG
ncbi:MAG: hypothetical protein GY719_05480 [bacterium]|nr:hypothetical protein [bacterium]